MKECTKCLETKELDEYYAHKHYKDGKTPVCRSCTSDARAVAYQNGGREQKRASLLKAWFGMTVEQYDALYDKQNQRCACCGKLHEAGTKRMAVDHVHDMVDGKDMNKGNIEAVRGLLCSPCNTGIGSLGDTVEGLQRGIDYLNRISKESME
jgi:hypothetical protein